MIVNRLVYVNPVEPQPISMRVPMNIETKLDVQFRTQGGTPWTSDVAGQLSVTTRSDGQTNYYTMAATDLVNGKARVVIPAQTDPNGARLRLTGTVNGEPYLLAMGTLLPVDFAGMLEEQPDVIDDIDLTFIRDNDVNISVKLWASEGVPYDLSAAGTVISAAVYASNGGGMLTPLVATVIDVNQVELTLGADVVNTLPDHCWWSLLAGTGFSSTTLAQGNVTVEDSTPPPMTTTVISFNYTKQATLVDAPSGQIIHCNNALDILRISNRDSNGNPAGTTLDLLMNGDTITLGATTWTVLAVRAVADYFDVSISPATQDAASGVTNTTFARP